ncbi:MAG TPA: MEKHLA domain-containing protein [Nitrospira sp.]|nr:MEKHLA domain-containing protein [Nitrospira sp.]
MSFQPWLDPTIVEWTQRLLDSYRHWVGAELLERIGDPELQAYALFESPLVVVSHGTQTDPILNYGNRMALTLWDMTWEQLIGTPSRLTAEPVNRAERESMLEQARVRGYLDTYRGVRISRSGRRFLVEGAVIWNVLDAGRQPIGQAATFARWTWLS